ncbi:MAG: PEGA domain-containing protein [Candidatus Scalindua sp.]
MPIKKLLIDKSINVAYKYLKYLGAEVQIYGSICVKSEPSMAEIYLDGKEAGTTTETITGLEPGKYTVEVRMNGYEVWSKNVEVKGGSKKTLTAVLQMKTGSISVKSEPANARIFLDGKEVGTTPDVIRSTVSGSHEVELKLDGYEVWSKRVNIEEDKEKALSAVLRIKAGSLMIESEPTDAKIYLDGEEIGTTPNIIRSIAPDTYEVEVKKDGYDVWSEFVDVEGDKEKVLTAVLQIKTGSISVMSKPAKARIFLDGKEVGTTPDILESVDPGSHEVEVRKDGYDVWSKSVEVESDKKKTLTLELQINTGSISVKSEPAKARIFLDGKEVGITPDTLWSVTPGKHEVEIRKDRYEVWRESVDVKVGEENTLTSVLQVKTGSIMIDSEPSIAKIYLDGKEVGITPETITDLKPGKHTLEIKKARYEVWRENIETEADAEKTLTAVLQTMTGTIIIKSRPSRAKIFLDDKEVGITPDIIRSIDPGKHEVEIRMDGYEIWRERLNVIADKEKALTAVLQVKTGSLVIDSEPANARIYLDGGKIGTTPDTLRYIVPGAHEVEVRMDGYEIWRESIEIEADIEKALTATLRAKSGTVSIKSEPTNALIYLDGKEVGNTPATLKPVRGIHEVEVRMDGYEIWRENVDIQADKEKTLTAALQLKTGTILVESEPANAKIYLDGKEAGNTPVTLRHVRGMHEVEVRMDGYEVWRQSVEVEADKEKSLTAVLQIETGSVLVESEPTNATIYLDGDEVGITPDTLRSIIPGRHLVEVKMDGYKVWSKSIIVRANNDNALTVVLQTITGSILIESEPAKARIFLNGEEVGTTPESFRYITPGPHELEVKMDKYEVWREIVDVEAGKEKVLTALLQLRTGSILIESEPTKATVYLNGKDIGTTAETITGLIPGKYSLEVRMDGYEVWNKSVEVDADTEKDITAVLQIKPGTISINSEPTKARIFMDGKNVGTTAETITDLTPGKYTVEVKLDGYGIWHQVVDVEPDKETVLMATLQLKTGSIMIESEPAKAMIYLDGEDVGITPDTLWYIVLGKHEIKVEMEGYEVWSKIVDVEDDKQKILTAVLQIKTGSIAIESKPSNAVVYIDGEEVGKTPDTVKSIVPGAHEVQVMMDGYEVWNKCVNIKAEKEKAITAVLQVKTGSININSDVPDAKIYLDGEEIATTPETITGLIPGEYTVEVKMDGYEDWSKIVAVEADKENVLTIALQMKAGTIMLESKPTKARLYLDGKDVGKAPEIIKNILPGKHLLEARMDGYEGWSEMVDVEAYKDYALKAVLLAKPGSISIKSEPTNATIYLDDEEVGITPQNIIDLKPGKYTVEVRMNRYEVWSECVDVAPDKTITLKVPLQLRTGSIMIESVPTKARIYLNGKEAGVTPETLRSIIPGTHKVEIRMDGLEIWREIIEVEADKENTLKAVLQLKPGSINIKSEPTNATMYLDGNEIGTTPATITNLMPGKYMLELKMDGYDVWGESINVETDIEETLAATLQLKTGSIMIDSEPENAAIYLDGEDIGTTPDIIIRPAVPGKHKVEIRMDGYKVWSENVEFEADKEKSLTAVLQSKTGSLMIDSVPANATIYLDGKEIGTTSDALISATPGIHEIEVKMDGYEVWHKRVNIKVDKNKALTAVLRITTGAIKINSEPASATIYLNGKEVGTTPDTIRSIAPGTHEIEVHMEGYEEWKRSIKVNVGKEKVLTALLQTKIGSILIESKPSNARIYLDDREVGKTPANLKSIVLGTHEVEVRMDGYEVWSESVIVEEDREKTITAALQLKTGSVIIESTPPNASVFLDGEDVGKTPANLKSIAPGTHEVEVRMDGYEVWSESVIVEEDIENTITAALQLKTGSVIIESTPPNASVFLDGEDVGKTPANLKSIVPGRHIVEVRMEGYEIWSESVDIEAKTEKTLTAVLVIKTGSIMIESEPTEAKIYLDGEEAGTTPDTLSPITIGVHEVEIRMDGYEVWSDIANIEPEKETALKAVLQIKNGSIRIESTPPNAEIYLDGEKVGTTPDTLLSIVPGQHEVEVKMDGYEAWSENVDVETDKETFLTVVLKLRTGSLSIKSKPAKAEIFLNGEGVGTLPKTLTDLKPGKYSVEVRLAGYEVWSETVDIEADLEKTLTAELQTKTGSIIIESKPAKAKVYLDGEEVGTTPATLMSVAPGVHEVEVRMDGYDVWSKSVEVEAEREKVLTSVLRIRTGSFSVNSEPANAMIYLDGDYIGTTPEIIRSSVLGTHVVEIRKEGYEVWREIVDIKVGEGKALTAALQMITGTFTIESNPSMAMIYLNGREAGTTPATITDLKPGKYIVEVKRDGYRTWDKRVNVRANIENTVSAVLRLNTGSIMIDSEPTKAGILLNGKDVGTTPETITGLDPGKYNIEVRLDRYEVWSESTKVKIGRESALKASLQIKSGSISINSKPSNARIYIDGKDVGITPGIIKPIDSGTHEVEVKKGGYETWSESVDVEADKEKSLTVVLQIKTSSISIDSDPANAVIYLDGEEVGMTPDTLRSIIPGTHEVEVKMDGYETWTEIINVESDEEKALIATLQIKAGSINIESEPTQAKILLDSKEAGITPVILKSVIPGTHEIEVRMDGYESWSEIVDVKPDIEKAITAVLQIKASFLKIESEPEKAKIFLDNKEVGTTPETITGLNPGKYTVEVVMDGYEPWAEIVDVDVDNENTLTAVLQKKTGSISIKSRPSKANIFLNGDEAGTVPKILNDLKPGKYTVEVMMDGYEIWSESVDVEANKLKILTAILQIKTGSINIKSEPSTARIFLDNKDVGRTPETLTGLKPGKYTVEIRMDGYETWREIVDIEADKENALTAALQIMTTTISIKSKPSKANIYIDGNDAGITPGIIKSVSPGTHKIEVRMDGYEVWSESVDVEADKEKVITAVLQTKAGSISIKSEPAKAMIYLDGEEVGTTPYSLKSVATGTHEVEVRMDGYEVWSEVVDVVADKDITLTAVLQTKSCSISIKSEPANANIYIDGNDAGITPGIIKSVAPGTHEIEVRMDGYEVWSESVDIDADKENDITAVLQIKAGSFSIKSEPAKATIFLDGKEVGITPDNLKSVAPGTHEIEVKMDGYEVWSEVVDVVADKENDITAVLQAKAGSISIKSEPAKAKIFLDGEVAGITPAVLKSVAPGTHDIEVSMDGYEVWSKRLDVEAGKEKVLSATLQMKVGSINIKSDPANAMIFLDGKNVGITPETIYIFALSDLKPEKHTVEVKMDGYEVWSEVVDVVADKENVLTATLQMKAGSISIKSDPANAMIFLDGKNVDTTPKTITDLKPGKYKVEVKMEGYEVWHENVELDIGKHKALIATLQIMTGSISIESEPVNARIFLDGKEFGTTPVMRRSIDHGKHEVEVRMEGYKVWSKIINLKAGKEKLLTATLQIMSGTISIESTPTKARIYLDGEDVGTTPDSLRSIVPGTHEIKVKMVGYEVWSKKLDVEAGKENSLTMVLQKKTFPVDIKHETSSKKLIRLRSTYDKLSVSQIQSLPHISIREKHKHVFLCHSTISHDYEVKTINGDEIVIDHTTELIWHQSGSSAYMDMRRAKKWLKKLNIGGYSGYHDWRLPTLEEASTLLELDVKNGNFIDPVFDKKQWGMWTDDRDDKNHAWIVTFVNGTINKSHVGSPATFVRPVRLLK